MEYAFVDEQTPDIWPVIAPGVGGGVQLLFVTVVCCDDELLQPFPLVYE